MARKPSYPATYFIKKQRKKIVNRLKRNKVWKSRRSAGSCILIDPARIRNPYFKDGKGPEFFNGVQIIFIEYRHHLPDNEGIEEVRERIEFSHICGRDNCINIVGRHIKAEEHWRNMLRILHHALSVRLFFEKLVLKRYSTRDPNQKSRFRCVRSDCKCRPRCFKIVEIRKGSKMIK